jgi:DNA sulfur modification protein DndD
MHIERIHLRDWKSYVDVAFEFLRPTRNKNVVLIGARNGYGKTSLLEAVTLCLFGYEGMPHLPRGTLGDVASPEAGYDEFLTRALHGGALAAGRNSMSVTVSFQVDGNRITVMRQWHFQGNGRHKSSDEEVRIFEGDQPVRVGRLENKNEFYRNYIARTFIPFWLAPFFLFDGEQVQRLANKDLSSQVRAGIEGLLGIGTLRELQDDLRSYALNRRGNSDRGGDATLQSLGLEVQALEAELNDTKRVIESLQPRLVQQQATRDGKLRKLRSVAGGNKATLEEQYNRKSQADSHRAILHERLVDFLQTDLALIVSGSSLRRDTLKQLKGEAVRENWEAGKLQGQSKLEEFTNSIDLRKIEARPPLAVSQVEWMKKAIAESWDTLWYPPPVDCSNSYLHTAMGSRERQLAIGILERVDSLAIGDLQQLLADQESAEQDLANVESTIREMSSIATEVERLSEEMRAAQEEETSIKRTLDEAKRKSEGLTSQLNVKRADLERVREQLDRSQPVVEKVQKAEKIANMLGTLIEEMYPLKVSEVGTAMTTVYKKLAHKTLLDHIEISENCDVSLLDRVGNDIRRFDPSAGENQIFAISLISAIAQVSEIEIPMIVDTPLARLDGAHRQNVLAHWASQVGQVILLSSTDEVTGEYYKSIENRVCSSYHLSFEEIEDGLGVTEATKGYLK